MRKLKPQKRVVLADPVYDSKVVTKLINNVMWDGKKNLAQEIVYGAFKKVEEKTKQPAMEVFKKALVNLMPNLELKVTRIGGANYQVPTPVSPVRQQTLALRWLVGFARKRSEKVMIDRLANEIIDATNGIGGAAKKREDVHKMAAANKAYAHLARGRVDKKSIRDNGAKVDTYVDPALSSVSETITKVSK